MTSRWFAKLSPSKSRARDVVSREKQFQAQIADGHIFTGAELRDGSQKAQLRAWRADNQRRQRPAHPLPNTG